MAQIYQRQECSPRGGLEGALRRAARRLLWPWGAAHGIVAPIFHGGDSWRRFRRAGARYRIASGSARHTCGATPTDSPGGGDS
eukprot:scaffold46462_cov39-Phaeocystis_antarctica.AAC.1